MGLRLERVEMKQKKNPPNVNMDNTHEEIAKSLGISRNAVYQIEKRAIAKFKKALWEKHKLKVEDIL
jgi:DNA-directed RNA polymerase sigma subunit (sigma70/sigma32)